jgi:hypothetical protein
MKTLREYVSEGLLKGQESIIADGDKIDDTVTEFETLKKMCTNIKNYYKNYDYEKPTDDNIFNAKMKIPLLFEYAGIKNKIYNTILFQIIQYPYGDNWYCQAFMVNPMRHNTMQWLGIPGSRNMAKRPDQILKNAIEPLFTDFNTFTTWLSSEIKERKYDKI